MSANAAGSDLFVAARALSPRAIAYTVLGQYQGCVAVSFSRRR